MKRIALLSVVGALVLMGAGCSTGSSSSAPDGGIFTTSNLGGAWTQLTVLNQGAKVGSIGNVATVSTAFDPQEATTMYVGTTQNGLLMTLDGGQSWQQARGLTSGQVTSIAVDPQDKCTVFVARLNQLLKTETCGRDWGQVYYDPRTTQQYTSVVIDPSNPKTVYAGNVDGDILRSEDGGASWRVLYRADARINMITIDRRSPQTLYIATNGAGVLKSTNRGEAWTEIRAQLDGFDGSRRPIGVYIDPSNSNTIFHVSRNGILRSTDGGSTWLALSLPTPSAQTNIRAFALHPRNPSLLVYATETSVVFTDDLGQTWTPKKLPTSRSASFLVFDAAAQSNLYLGTIPR